MAKTFRQLRNDWMDNNKSDAINYCMPVNIGVISQNIDNPDEKQINAAVEKIIKQLERWFGKFSARIRSGSHHQLIVMKRENDPLADTIARHLTDHYKAIVVTASEQAIKKYCWITIALWDGTTENNDVYPAIKEILSTINTVEDDYQLRFPENRPVFQIVLPLSRKHPEDIDYSVREIYPHMLETINKKDPWFIREKFKPQSWLDKRRDSKRRNFKANALKLKKFNKHIIRFSKRIDGQSKNIYDLLPWQHFEEKYKKIDKQFQVEDHVNITNLREIFYDVISMKAQESEDRQSIILLAFAAIALVSFVIYSDAPVPRFAALLFFSVFAACMTVAYLIYFFRVQISGSHKTYLEFRALAEGMRVQCYWYAAGINQSVGTKYTVKFQKDMQWAKQAFNAWYVSDYLKYHFPTAEEEKSRAASPAENPDKNETESPSWQTILRNRMIRAEWLGTLKHNFTEEEMTEPKKTVLPDEMAYYDRGASRMADTPKHTRFKKDLAELKETLGQESVLRPGGQYGYFYKTTRKWGKSDGKAKRRNVYALTAWSFSAAALFYTIVKHSRFEDFFVCLMGICTIMPLIVSGWAFIKAYGELAAKYSYCELLAEKALQDYQAVESKAPQKIKKIFEKYGVEALEENAEWLMIKNDREPTVPNG